MGTVYLKGKLSKMNYQNKICILIFIIGHLKEGK